LPTRWALGTAAEKSLAGPSCTWTRHSCWPMLPRPWRKAPTMRLEKSSISTRATRHHILFWPGPLLLLRGQPRIWKWTLRKLQVCMRPESGCDASLTDLPWQKKSRALHHRTRPDWSWPLAPWLQESIGESTAWAPYWLGSASTPDGLQPFTRAALWPVCQSCHFGVPPFKWTTCAACHVSPVTSTFTSHKHSPLGFSRAAPSYTCSLWALPRAKKSRSHHHRQSWSLALP